MDMPSVSVGPTLAGAQNLQQKAWGIKGQAMAKHRKKNKRAREKWLEEEKRWPA
jgi:hypothetical protein